MNRIETNQELEAKRIAAMVHREIEKQDVWKIEEAIRNADTMIENVKSDSHIGEGFRETTLNELFEAKRKAQDRLKDMNEKRMQELLDLNAKRNIFTISNSVPQFLEVNTRHISDAVASGSLEEDVIESLCKYHNNPDNAKKFEAINEASKNFLRVIRDNCMECTGRVAAVNTVLLAKMQANAVIALSGE
jgi:hypothetical protein